MSYQVVPASTPAQVHNCSVSPTSPSSPNTLVLKCLPGWDGGLQQAFTLKVLLGKNDTSKQKAAVGGYDSRGAGSEKAEEWITGASVRHVKDQTQENDLANSWKDVRPLEKGVLAVLSGQNSPHFTVSGLAAGQEYILQVTIYSTFIDLSQNC